GGSSKEPRVVPAGKDCIKHHSTRPRVRQGNTSAF
ncbi:unnamed protein product, partial [Ascophyllum nodosum]